MADKAENQVYGAGNRPRQKPLPPVLSEGTKGTRKYRCLQKRQHEGRVYYEGDVAVLHSPLPKGYDEYFEPMDGKRDEEQDRQPASNPGRP